jgi:GntR family carbon starvation induced transcriptional regulator
MTISHHLLDQASAITTSGTLASTIAARIRADILEGRLAPGTKLKLDTLRDQYGVSLSPLREALSRLGAEGLVVMSDQKGYRVAPVSAENLQEVMTLRANLEVMALEKSIENGDDRWEDALVAAYHRLQRLEESARKGIQLDGWDQAHRTFHITLFSASGMPLLLQFCNTLHDLGDRYRRLFLATNAHDRDVPAEHKAILDAALARDKQLACSLLRQHIERTMKNLFVILPSEKSSGPHEPL